MSEDLLFYRKREDSIMANYLSEKNSRSMMAVFDKRISYVSQIQNSNFTSIFVKQRRNYIAQVLTRRGGLLQKYSDKVYLGCFEK